MSPSTDFENMMREALVASRNSVLALAQEQNTDPRQFASTLLAIISTPHGGCALQLGDGVIVVGDSGNEWNWMFWPQRGEYANTTRFLTDDDAIDRVELENFSHPLADIALLSDGLEPLALHYASKSVHAPFFKGMFDPLTKGEVMGMNVKLSLSLEQFLCSATVSSRTDDDVSIVLATNRSHANLT